MLGVKRDFSPEPFRVFLSDIIFPSVFMSHSASITPVSEVSKVICKSVYITKTYRDEDKFVASALS